MADIGIELVREFFEAHQFLVKMHRKYVPTKKDRLQISEIDLAVLNLKPQEDKVCAFILGPRDIIKIPRAIVKVKSWHMESFSPALLNAFPKIFQFVSPGVVKLANQFFGTNNYTKILVVPSLPTTEAAKSKSIDILKKKGVDGVIEFKIILSVITDMVKKNRNYLESDILQLIRLFKVYDMLKGGQLELFGRRRKRTSKKIKVGYSQRRPLTSTT